MYFGGKEKNKHTRKRKTYGHGPDGKVPVFGMVEREGRVIAMVTPDTKANKPLRYRPLPLRRIYIPKSNGKLRPLGIPTMKDRAMQALHLLALDPIAETTADDNSYGFRKRRSCADAIEGCFAALKHRNPSWAISAAVSTTFVMRG